MDVVLFLVIVVLAVGIGCLASLFGIGGGFLLIPTMTMVVGLTTHEAVATIPLTIVFMSFSSTLAYAKQKRIDYKVTTLIIGFTVLGSILGVFVVDLVTGQSILILFGVVESTLAIILAVVKTPQERTQAKVEDPLKAFEEARSRDGSRYILHRLHVDGDGKQYYYAANLMYSVPLSFIAGFLSSMLGIGGGTLYIQLFVFICGMSIHMAIACSMASILLSAIASFLTYLFNSAINPGTLAQIDFLVAIAYGLGMVIGAQIGAHISKKIKSQHLKPLAAAMIIIIAGVMIIKAILNP
ncbi:MAG: sulfite exporter TauE/SafE family protein [Promethearchaeota archaeon]